MECPARDSVAGERKEEACGATVAGAYQIDPFLIEALQNPRHRLTGLIFLPFFFLFFFALDLVWFGVLIACWSANFGGLGFVSSLAFFPYPCC